MTSFNQNQLVEFRPKDIDLDGDVYEAGAGGFGHVWFGYHKVLKIYVAIKIFHVAGGPHEKALIEHLMKEEISHIQKAQHQNIVHVLGWVKLVAAMGIVMEYCPNGSIKCLLLDKRIPLTVVLRVWMLLSIARALACCHTLQHKCLVHGDVKPDNILIAALLICKLCDFGTAELITLTGSTTVTSSDRSKKDKIQYTPWYTAPEKLKDLGKKPTKAMDVYAFALMIHMFLARKSPYHSGNEKALLDAIQTGLRPNCDAINQWKSTLDDRDRAIVESLEDMMKQCWSENFSERPTMTEVCERLETLLDGQHESIITQQAADTLAKMEEIYPPPSNLNPQIPLDVMWTRKNAPHQGLMNAANEQRPKELGTPTRSKFDATQKDNFAEVTCRGELNIAHVEEGGTASLSSPERNFTITKSLNVPLQCFRAVHECNLFACYKTGNQNRLEIAEKEDRDQQSGSIVFTGSGLEIDNAITMIRKVVMKVSACPVPAMGLRSKFLFAALNNEHSGLQPGAVDVRQIIQDHFANEGIYASLQLVSDNLCLVVRDSGELIKAQKALAEIVQHVEIQNFTERHSDFETLTKSISEDSVQVFQNLEESSLAIVGLSAALPKAVSDVCKVITSSAMVVTRLFWERSFVITYLEEHLKDLKEYSDNLKWVGLEFKAKESHVFVNGSAIATANVCDWLKEMCDRLVVIERPMRGPGVRQYLRSLKGKAEINYIAKKNQCIGVVDYPLQEPFTWQKKAVLRPACSAAKHVDRGPLKVVVRHGDITTSECDAIVSSTLDMRGVIGRSIVAKTGPDIIDECKNNPIFKSHNLRITSGGRLWKYVLHLAIPNYAWQLESFFTECLTQADGLPGVESLAVPAIGSGEMGTPGKLVARNLAAAIDKISKADPKNLKRIEVCVFQERMLPDFQRELLSQTPRAPRTRTPVVSSGDRSSLTVTIKQGDITTSTCDAIVSSTLDMRGAIGKRIVEVAGPQIIDECKNNAVLENSILRITLGGNLWTYIFHLDIPNYASQLESFFTECLTQADRSLGLESMAVPAIGAGEMGIPGSVVAKSLAASVEKFNNSMPESLKRIEVYVFHERMLPDFHRELLCQTPDGVKLPATRVANPSDAVRVRFCSWKKENVETAFDAVERL